MRKVLSIIEYGLAAIGCLGIAAWILLSVLHLHPYILLSGSMEPQYPTGSLVIVEETDPAILQAGDVITFRLDNETTVTHRIDGIEEDGSYRTKGDANDIVDARTVSAQDVVGTPSFVIPVLGYWISYAVSKAGLFCLAAVILSLLFLEQLLSYLDARKEEAACA